MGVVHLRQTGFLFEDTFETGSLDPRWELVPHDLSRIEPADGSLRLKHGAAPLHLFLPELSDEPCFVLDVCNDYNPTSDGDLGGLIVYADDGDHIRLEEYFDRDRGTAEAYPWLRLVRNHNVYSAYWSRDGRLWHALGSRDFDQTAPKIGLFLEGGGGQDLNLLHVRAFRSTRLTVDSLQRGVRASLLDASGRTIETQTCRTNTSRVQFDLSGLPVPFTGRFSVTLEDGSSRFTEAASRPLWGGDDYAFGHTADLYYLDAEGREVRLQESLEEFLGYLSSGSGDQRVIKMIAKNPSASGRLAVSVELAAAHGTDHYLRLASLAPDSPTGPGSYGPHVDLPAIPAGGQQPFWLKILRDPDPTTGEIHFGLNVTAGYTF